MIVAAQLHVMRNSRILVYKYGKPTIFVKTIQELRVENSLAGHEKWQP